MHEANHPQARRRVLISKPGRSRTFLTFATALVWLAACGAPRDDQTGREQIVGLVRVHALEATEHSDEFVLPDGLEGLSNGGHVWVVRDDASGALVVVFMDFRGLNHYTGWVYSSSGVLDEDPLGHQPFTAKEYAKNWFLVDAG